MEYNITLNNGISMPTFMLGTNVPSKEILYAVVDQALKDGCRAFDTAPNYRSGQWLGEIIEDLLPKLGIKREELFIQTKLDWNDMLADREEWSIDNTLHVMRMDYIDAWVMHWPEPTSYVKSYKIMERVLKSGKTRSIGVSNFHMRHWMRLFDSNIDVIPQINQIELHPLRTCEELVSFCNEYHIIVESYSPLCKMISPIKESIVLQEISKKYHCSIPQLILSWHANKGLIPINKSTKPHRIAENMKCMQMNLDYDDIKAIDSLNINYKLIVESIACPGF